MPSRGGVRQPVPRTGDVKPHRASGPVPPRRPRPSAQAPPYSGGPSLVAVATCTARVPGSAPFLPRRRCHGNCGAFPPRFTELLLIPADPGGGVGASRCGVQSQRFKWGQAAEGRWV